MKKKFNMFTLVTCFLCFWSVSISQAVTYDATAEFLAGFDAAQNPNGVWSYGWMPSGDFSEFNVYTDSITGEFKQWYTPGMSDTCTPAVGYNLSPGSRYGVAPGQLTLHPGPRDQASTLRFTAPAAAEYSIMGEFFPGDGGIMSVGVRQGSSWLWQGSDAGAFNLAKSLSVGDTVDFVVFGGYFYGNTPLNLKISATPVPAAVWLFGAGLLGLIGIRRRLKA